MYLLVEYVQAEIDIVNLKLAAVLKRYHERQLHGLIDARIVTASIDRHDRGPFSNG